jgi:hypothetical protein
MNEQAAAEHLQVIRTLMERAAVYRRALAPIMIFAGIAGITAAGFGWVVQSATGFVLMWFGVAAVTLIGALLLTRRQALRDAEPFWSPPTRRVTQAMLPALVAGLVIGICVLVVFAKPGPADPPTGSTELDSMIWLPAAWAVLYGCALHAAGFFTPRGLRWLGWLNVLGGLAVFLGIAIADRVECPAWWSHALMGLYFGVPHLAYGVYLHLTKQGKNVA